MDPRAPRKTPADYMVMAISPVLIMLLVGSLTFFLIQVFYRGALAGNVRWVVFWFVLAIVLVSRIGIEQGGNRAAVYGLGLAGATWFYLMWVHPAWLLGALLLGIVWWSAHKLTCDCTLINEDEDASGDGLLETAATKSNQPGTAGPDQIAAQAPAAKTRRRNRRPPHPHGLWVVYFSLAALPLFGIGQMLLPGTEPASRRIGLGLLLVYMLAALGLLLTTSFLGLRRYLRQRRMAMPTSIAFGWIKFGVGVAVSVLAISLFLPRPGVTDAWGGLRYQLDYRLRQASNYAARLSGHGQGKGRPGRDLDKSRRARGQGAVQKAETSRQQAANDQPSNRKRAGENARTESGSQHQPAPGPRDSAHNWYVLFRGLLLLAAALALGVWLVRRRHLLVQIIRSFMAALLDFFQNLFKLRTALKRSSSPAAKTSRPKRPTFAAYENPFVTGGDPSWPPEQLILYTFEAVQVWAEEQGLKVCPEQTAREFCVELSGQFPEAAPQLEHLSFLYGHAAYATGLPANTDLEPLRQLWLYLTAAVTTDSALP